MCLKYLQLNQYPSGTSLVDPQHVSGTSLCKEVLQLNKQNFPELDLFF